MTEKELPSIAVEKRDLSPSGTILKQEYYCIKGESLKECEESLKRVMKR